MKVTDNTAIWSIRLEPELRRKLVELSEQQDRQPPDVVRRLIKLAYQDLEQQQQRQQAEATAP